MKTFYAKIILVTLFLQTALFAQKTILIKYTANDEQQYAFVFKKIRSALDKVNTPRQICYLYDGEVSDLKKKQYSFYGVLTFKRENEQAQLEVKIHFYNNNNTPGSQFKEFDISGLFDEKNLEKWSIWANGVAEDIKQLYNTQKMNTMYVKVFSPEKISEDIKLLNNPPNIKIYYYKYSRLADYCENANEQCDIIWCEAGKKEGRIMQSLHRTSLVDYKKIQEKDIDEVKKRLKEEYSKLLSSEYSRIYDKPVLFSQEKRSPAPVATFLNANK